MKQTKLLYALLTSHCNLSCPHCDIKSCSENFNEDEFIDQLRKFDGEIILFGGEPSLYEDRLFKIASDPIIFPKIKSITTNLIKLNDDLISLYSKIGSLGTSWNLSRFTEKEYETWLNNIEMIHNKSDLKIGILITMTEDLLNFPIDEFIKIVNSWNDKVINNINFEHFIGDNNKEYFNKVDEWVCEVYKKWETKIFMKYIGRIKNWHNDCSNIYTLHPDGTLSRGCPHHSEPVVPEECYSCERADVCRPCQLQKYCSYPKKFAELIKNEELSKDKI